MPRIYVGNLPYGTTSEELEEMFAPFGKVTSAHVIREGVLNPSASEVSAVPLGLPFEEILAGLASNPTEDPAELDDALLDASLTAYRAVTTIDGATEYDDGFKRVLFDHVPRAPDDRPVQEYRLIATSGRSVPARSPRDRSRMRGFLPGGLGPDTDRGHFMGHALGGGLDSNLFPQHRPLNRGWSADGKLFRSMETYAASRPGTFCFARPLYADHTWRPAWIEYAVLRHEGVLWVALFPNT